MPATEPTEQQIARFLQATRETIAEVPICWLATRAADGGGHARAVKVHAGPPDGDEWTRRFLVRRGSRKVPELHAAPRVTLAFQHGSGDRYVGLGDEARFIEGTTEMRALWSPAADAFYPSGFAEANMIAVHVLIDRIELHARGITGEPFGHGRTLPRRIGPEAWRFVPD